MGRIGRNGAAAIIGASLLAGCAAAPRVATPVRAPRMGVPYGGAGLERVIGQDAAGLTRLFGQPDADVRETVGRRLQFAGPICVLDTYLYPREKDGRGEPVVTYLDAREPDGSPIDRASCVAALTRRDGK